MRSSVLCLGAVLLLILPMAAQAQVTTGTLYGKVLDPTGAVIPNAEVTATNNNTATTKSATTDERGDFTIPFLTVGSYTITVRSTGFRTHTETGLQVAAGQKLSETYVMELGVSTETVTVTSATPLLNTVNAEQDIDLNRLQVAELPMLNRDVTNILNLGTGVSSDGTTISINGLAPRGFTFSVDGVDAAPDSEFPSLALYQNFNFIKGVSLEAVEQVQISKNIFSAEIGNTMSGNVNLTTKSGSNEFHGSLFENYQAGGLNANNHFLARKTTLIFHQFGGSIGGPIVRNKVFFFGAYEGYRQNEQAPISGIVPTRYVRDLVTASVPESKPYWDLWPLPTQPVGPTDLTGQTNSIGVRKKDDNHAVVRGDYNISDTDFFTARYTRGRPFSLSPRLQIGNPRTFEGLNENVSASYTRVWQPTLTSETRYGFNLSKVNRSDGIYSNGQIPEFDIDGLPGTDGEIFVKEGSTSSWAHNFAYTRGRHSMKFGGNLALHLARRVNEETPTYNYSTLDDALANIPNSAGFIFLNREFEISRWFGGVFFQDDIRMTPSFMLNLGLRWDLDGVPKERDGRFFNRDGPYGPSGRANDPNLYRPSDSIWDTSYTDFSPRIGFAWTLDDSRKTVLRGGGGVFFIPFNFFAGPVDITRNSATEPAVASLNRTQLADLGLKYPSGNSVVLPLVEKSNIETGNAIDPNFKSSYALQWTLGIERQLSETMVFNIAYVANHGVGLTWGATENRVDPLTGQRTNPEFAGFTYYQNVDSSLYHSLQTSLKKRISNNVFNINYTYASNTSYSQGNFNCCSGENPQDLNDLRANHGPTPFHIRHTFRTDWVYEIPVGRSLSGISRILAEGWQLGGIWTATSGAPIDISCGVGNSPGCRPDFVASSHQAAIREDFRTHTPEGHIQYLDPAAFAQVPIMNGRTARPGNLGRRALNAPGSWTVDLSISKGIRFGEGRQRLQFRADLFNSLNHTNLTSVNTNFRNASFGRITSSQPGRVTQLSVRFDF